MNPSFDPLDRPATRSLVRWLASAGHLSPEAREAALVWLKPALDWRGWSNRALLFIGAALVLSGIVYFFAYNWAEMSAVAKFGVIEVSIATCLLAAWRLGLNGPAGKVLLLSASFLAGVFVAVFGQVYQTGADAFELFLGWAALSLGWVVLSNFAALWVMWLTVLHTGFILFWSQVLAADGSTPWSGLFLLLGAIDGAALVGREIGVLRKVEWLRGSWLRGVLWLALTACLTVSTQILIVEPAKGGIPGAVATLLLAVAWAAGYAFYRFRSPDPLALTIGATSVCAVVLTLLGKALFDDWNDSTAFLIFGLAVVALVGAAVQLLRTVARRMEAETHG